ncbi:MAG: acyltransferase 3 [Gallionellaceae bacterium]|nr:MAG: acyltransferase 3 [Gallionellaceae bacterium]
MNQGLTSFRALAFFAIFLFHLGDPGASRFDVQGGYLGVEAFFVLSGFLLTPILVEMKSSLNKRDFFIHFYGRRALRIFPLYYAYLLIVAAISFWLLSQPAYSGGNTRLAADLNQFIKQLPWTVTYTYDFYHVSNYFRHSFLATHFWSLAVEEQFYLVWPLAIFFIPARHLKKFLLLVIVAGPLTRFLLAVAVDANMLPVLRQTDLVIYILPFSHIDAFAIGGFFALYGKSRPGYLVWASLLLVLALGFVTSWLSAGQLHLGELGYGPFMKDSYKYVWGYSAVTLVLGYMLVQIRNKTFMPALFENPLLVYLGTISYGLYVFHYPVLWLVYSTMHRSPEIVRASATLLITVIISMVSYELMEKRFINSKDKYFARTSAAKPH